MLKGLETGKLIIADLEIGDEDIPVIIRFFRSKLVLVTSPIFSYKS